MAKTLPPMMHVMREIAGVELPGYMGKLAEDTSSDAVATGDDSAVTKRIANVAESDKK
jgi:hypothetical protein